MLALSRKKGERLYLDGPAIVEVIRLKGKAGGVVLGVIAPDSTNIRRGELIDPQDQEEIDARHQAEVGQR